MADRRANVRAVVRLQVEERELFRVPLYVTANLSVGGMFLITKTPLPPQTQLRLRFRLPKDRTFIQTVAKVLWARDDSTAPGPAPGMGVQFLECSPEDRERIRAFIEAWALAADAAGPAQGDEEP